MVGFDPATTDLTKLQYSIAGIVSGVMTRFVCQPLDVLKIRLQLQLEPIHKQGTSKYHGMRQAVRTIQNEETLRALWKGHVPAQMLSIAYGASQFVSFEILTHLAWDCLPKNLTNEWRPTLHFFCGGAAGCMATCVSQPFDVIRTRFVGQGEPKIYHSMLHATKSIYTKEGPKAFYKGLLPTLIQIGPNTALQFGFYTFLLQIWRKWTNASMGHIGWIESMVCGSIAGMGAKGAVYPLDLVKKRLQVQGFEEARKAFGKVGSYSGLVDCFAKIFRQEGIKGFFKGFMPSLFKAALATGCHFCFYEQACNALRLSNRIQRWDRRNGG